MANAENSDGGGKVISPSTTVEERTENDPITPIVKQILSREKENEQATKKVKELIRKEGKKRIQTTLIIQKREKMAEKLTQDNGNIDDKMNEVMNVLTNLHRSLATRPHRQEPAYSENFYSSLDATVKNLKKLLSDIVNDIKAKEKQLKELSFSQEQQQYETRQSKSDVKNQTNEKKEKELKSYAKLLADFQEVIKDWLRRLANTFREPDNERIEQKFATFSEGFQQIIDLIDECLTTEIEHDRLKDKRNELEAHKNQLHDEVSKRLNERKPLDRIPPNVRRELEQIQRKCAIGDRLPETKDDIAVHLEELYEWVERQLNNGGNQLNEIDCRIEDVKSERRVDEKLRNLDSKIKDEEIRMYEERIEKLKRENQRLHNMVDHANQGKTDESETTDQQQPP